MTITYPTKWDDGDADNDVQMLPKITPVPVAVSGKWTLSNITVDSNGYLDASAVAPASYAERYIPGVLEGHMYKVVVVIAAADDPITITMGGVSLGAPSTAGTYTYYFRPTDGLPLKFNYGGAATLTASITSVVVQAVDPMKLDLLPAEVEAARNV
jgi:hypothetical protein